MSFQEECHKCNEVVDKVDLTEVFDKDSHYNYCNDCLNKSGFIVCANCQEVLNLNDPDDLNNTTCLKCGGEAK